MAETYFDLLRRPEWQRVRLTVMESCGFQCEMCGDRSSTLNVHHTYYQKSKKPWEYPKESLRCYCEPCHEKAQRLLEQIKTDALGRLSFSQTLALLGYAYGMLSAGDPDMEIYVSDLEFAEGIGDFWRLRPCQVTDGRGLNTVISGKRLAHLRQLDLDVEYAQLNLDVENFQKRWMPQ